MSTDGDLRILFRRHIVGHWTPVETAGTVGGVPDHNFLVGGAEGWIENKQTHAWAVGMRPLQVGWLDRRAREGGRAFVAVRRWKRPDGADELWLIGAEGAKSLADSGLRGVAPPVLRGRWSGGPSSWDWSEVRRILCAPLLV